MYTPKTNQRDFFLRYSFSTLLACFKRMWSLRWSILKKVEGQMWHFCGTLRCTDWMCLFRLLRDMNDLPHAVQNSWRAKNKSNMLYYVRTIVHPCLFVSACCLYLVVAVKYNASFVFLSLAKLNDQRISTQLKGFYGVNSLSNYSPNNVFINVAQS